MTVATPLQQFQRMNIGMTQTPSNQIRESKKFAILKTLMVRCLSLDVLYKNDFIRNKLIDSKICGKTDTF